MISYKGTRWYKCDFHLHTRASKCFEDEKTSASDFIDKVVAEGIECIAITDHNTADSIDEIKIAAKEKGVTVFPGVENKNLFDLNKEFSKTITEQFSKLGILDLNKSRGAFAAYWETLSPDMKSVAASGWNAELIPEDDILQSQFPDVLEELKTNEATRDEIEAMLKEVNDLEEEEYNEEDYEVYPKAVLKEYRDKLKEINAEIKAANKEIGNLTKRIKLSGNDKALQSEKTNLEKQVQELEPNRDEIEQKLATHTNYETRLRDAKKVIKEIKDRKEELIAKAREKITPDEAKELILARWKNVLSSTIMAYVADYQRGFLNRLENLYEKYTVTINEILEDREKESAQLAGFLKELGYE